MDKCQIFLDAFEKIKNLTWAQVLKGEMIKIIDKALKDYNEK